MTELVVIGPMTDEIGMYRGADMYHVHSPGCFARSSREYKGQEDQDAWDDPQDFVSVEDVVSTAFQEDLAANPCEFEDFSWKYFEHAVSFHSCVPVNFLREGSEKIVEVPAAPVVPADDPTKASLLYQVRVAGMAGDVVIFPAGARVVRKGRGFQYWHTLTRPQYVKLLDDLRAVEHRMSEKWARDKEEWRTLEAVRRSIKTLSALQGVESTDLFARKVSS